jgi:hypothetical protein
MGARVSARSRGLELLRRAVVEVELAHVRRPTVEMVTLVERRCVALKIEAVPEKRGK